jgi:hypothetical protein
MAREFADVSRVTPSHSGVNASWDNPKNGLRARGSKRAVQWELSIGGERRPAGFEAADRRADRSFDGSAQRHRSPTGRSRPDDDSPHVDTHRSRRRLVVRGRNEPASSTKGRVRRCDVLGCADRRSPGTPSRFGLATDDRVRTLGDRGRLVSLAARRNRVTHNGVKEIVPTPPSPPTTPLQHPSHLTSDVIAHSTR